MRLDKWLATLGKGSRSEVRQMIRDGQAAVNGQTVRDPAADCDPERDTLSLRGEPADGRITRHVMMHKPAGVLTAARDNRQMTVMDLLPPVKSLYLRTQYNMLLRFLERKRNDERSNA